MMAKLAVKFNIKPGGPLDFHLFWIVYAEDESGWRNIARARRQKSPSSHTALVSGYCKFYTSTAYFVARNGILHKRVASKNDKIKFIEILCF